MVFYFEVSGGLRVYMGRDKFENENLIAYGWPEDVWFHVDDLSSAHVYLRLPRGPLRAKYRETGNLEHLPEVLKECCALVKANSIEGCKKHAVEVVYTPWENLKKTSDMVTGQIGFFDQKKVQKVRDVTREREILKRLEKTKTEASPDFYEERQARDRDVKNKQKEKARLLRKQEAIDAEIKKQEKEERSYDRLFQNAPEPDALPNATDDISASVEAEDDFM